MPSIITEKVDVNEKNGQLSETIKLKTSQKVYLFLKNICDRIIAFLLIVILIPFWLILAIIVRCSSKSSALFKQKRIGKNRRQFNCYKWRSLREDAPKYMANKNFNDIDSYATKIGKFLRKTSIDELAQLLNVLKGDMSIIGYRPLIPQETEEDILRTSCGVYQIRPGITGWAQINDRNITSAEEKVKLDLYYLQHVGLWMDIKIFFATFTAIFKTFKKDKSKEKKEESSSTKEGIKS